MEYRKEWSNGVLEWGSNGKNGMLEYWSNGVMEGEKKQEPRLSEADSME